MMPASKVPTQQVEWSLEVHLDLGLRLGPLVVRKTKGRSL